MASAILMVFLKSVYYVIGMPIGAIVGGIILGIVLNEKREERVTMKGVTFFLLILVECLLALFNDCRFSNISWSIILFPCYLLLFYRSIVPILKILLWHNR